jgi:glycosyltransferase involved in cell wall biosynthesis
MHQFYVPDVASTGQLLHELGIELTKKGFEVHVITTRPSYGPRDTWAKAPLKEFKDGVHVTRLLTTRMSKDRMLGRASNSGTYLIQLFFRLLFTTRKDTVYLYVMNPPFLGGVGAFVSMLRRHRYMLVLQDSYPHIATWMGKIKKGGMIERLWHRLNRMTYRRAEQTIVICEASRKLVIDDYGPERSRVHVVPNWADGVMLRPRPKRDSEFARAHGLVEPFTVLYSGNLGLYYEYETLLQAAALLKDDNFRLVFVGAGGRKAWLAEQIEARKLTNTLLLPYQPYEKLGDSLTACDASLVTIAEGIEGISFPSKLYSSLAIGRPIIAITEEKSEVRDITLRHDVGRWFLLGDPAGMAAGIREMMQEPRRLDEQGAKARALFEKHYSKEASCEQYERVLRMPRLASM